MNEIPLLPSPPTYQSGDRKETKRQKKFLHNQ